MKNKEFNSPHLEEMKKEILKDISMYDEPKAPKLYFAKYLPIEGEIFDGDIYLLYGKPTIAKSPDSYYNPHVGYFDGEQKAKLFLCSRDIQVGDEITYVYLDWPAIGMYCGKTKGVCGEPSKLNPHGIMRWAKVIGEISPEATWITEGDEFNEDNVRFAIYQPHEEDGWDSYEKWLESPWQKNIQIKGPCGHFH